MFEIYSQIEKRFLKFSEYEDAEAAIDEGH